MRVFRRAYNRLQSMRCFRSALSVNTIANCTGTASRAMATERQPNSTAENARNAPRNACCFLVLVLILTAAPLCASAASLCAAGSGIQPCGQRAPICSHLPPSWCFLSIQPACLIVVLPNLLNRHLVSECAILGAAGLVVPAEQREQTPRGKAGSKWRGQEGGRCGLPVCLAAP